MNTQIYNSDKATAYKLAQLYYLPKQGDPFKHKTQCPACQSVSSKYRNKCFTPFVHVSTGEILDPNVGFCDYASCPLNANNNPVTPYEYFLNNTLAVERCRDMIRDYVQTPRRKVTNYHFRIDWESVKPTLSLNPKCVDVNTLFLGLLSVFRKSFPDLPVRWIWDALAVEMYGTYMVGTYHNYGNYKGLNNSVIFWEIDQNMDVREGKIMQFDSATAHRIKNNCSINWFGVVSGKIDSSNPEHTTVRDHCLFGLHLLNTLHEDVSRVYVVESQKTAIAMRVYAILLRYRYYFRFSEGIPLQASYNFVSNMEIKPPVYMATGGSAMLSAKMLEPLRGREVICLPDSGGATEHWKELAEGMENVRVDDYMERKKEEGACGDNADLLDLIESGLTLPEDGLLN